MSTIKSYAVGNGDMFYIEHGSDNFTIIDSCLCDDNQKAILTEMASLGSRKGITRFISTHPDGDHIQGLEALDDKIAILNFYCVKNKVTKEDVTTSFTRYCDLRDSSKAFYISKGCTRKWMNQEDNTRGSSGINILWPNTDHDSFLEALEDAQENDGSPNNISAIIQYKLTDGATVLWMGDLETDFMTAIEADVDLPKVDILFAPHHGRDSGKIPESLLQKMSPRMIIIGEAPSEYLNYYSGYNLMTQNSTGDILFECESGVVHVFTSKKYSVDFLEDQNQKRQNYYYAGTLNVD